MWLSHIYKWYTKVYDTIYKAYTEAICKYSLTVRTGSNVQNPTSCPQISVARESGCLPRQTPKAWTHPKPYPKRLTGLPPTRIHGGSGTEKPTLALADRPPQCKPYLHTTPVPHLHRSPHTTIPLAAAMGKKMDAEKTQAWWLLSRYRSEQPPSR